MIAAPAAPALAASTYTMTDLGSLGYGVRRGFGINAGGEVAGQSYTNKTVQFPCGRHICTAHISHPFSWIAGKMTDLGALGGITSEAFAVNRAGDIVGVSTLPDLSNYGCCPGGLSGASGINYSHQVVGGSDNAQRYVHAVMWTNATITDLGTLADPQIAPFAQSTAAAVNNLGQVTGWVQTNTYATHGFLFSNGKMTDIGNIVPEAINDHGVIVGYGALIYSGGTVQDLNNLIPPGSGFTLDNATAINDNGQIVANGYNSTGQEHAFLLTPG